MRALRILLLPLSVMLAGFQLVEGQPVKSQTLDERMAQDKMPQSRDPLWAELAKCPVKMDAKTSLYGIDVIPAVKALNGKTVKISGFVLPLDGSDKTSYFLLAKRSPVCMYCPPGEPNEVIAVRSRRAVDWTDDMITVSGQFALVNDGEKGIFFELRNADGVK